MEFVRYSVRIKDYAEHIRYTEESARRLIVSLQEEYNTEDLTLMRISMKSLQDLRIQSLSI